MNLGAAFSFVERIAYAKGYRVSVDGKTVTSPRRTKPMAQRINRRYLEFGLWADGRTKTCRVHRLQAYQKFGEEIYKDGIEVRHLDGTKDNRASNIAIGTRSQNMMDRPPEVRRRARFNARKFDYSEIQRFRQNHTFDETLLAFGIRNQTTLYYILSKQEEAA